MLKTAGRQAKTNAAQTTTAKTTTAKTTTARGRIPRAAWPAIVRRRDDGEPLSCIARSFGVTPGAVSYVLKKSDTADRPNGEDTDLAPAPTAESPRSLHADRLAAAAETCCAVLEASGAVMTDELKAAIHEIRRSLAAIEIAAAQQARSG